MRWVTPELKAILIENGSRFFAGKKSDREEVLNSPVLALTGVKQGVKQLDPQGFKMLVGYTLGQEVPDLLHPVKRWYNNEIARFRQPQETKESSTKIKVERWDAKAVARDRNEERYDEIKQGLSAAGTEWNKLHRRTMEKIWDELDADEQEKCFNIAKRRSQGRREASVSIADYEEIAAFVRKMNNIYGARMVCLASWIDDKGHTQTSVYVSTA
ncbi:hypothetical protein B0H13DRAFT_1850426 [Mycena leptocephala]|nr:hypothetical protein B0H13DRAFT_1850426 [Mycena leptocephala]